MAKYVVGPSAVFIDADPDENHGFGKRCEPGEVIDIPAAMARKFVKEKRLEPYVPDDDEDEVEEAPVSQPRRATRRSTAAKADG